MLNRPAPKGFANPFRPIGIIAGSGPEAGVDLWSKLLVAGRTAQANDYRGDSSAPLVRIVSDPALGLAADYQPIIDQHLKNCISEISETCGVFTIACNALQARAKGFMPTRVREAFVAFDTAVDAALTLLGTNHFFLVGSSAVMSLSADSIYASLKLKYSISTPKDWPCVDALIQDIKLTAGKRPDLVSRLQAVVAEGGSQPIVLACTDFPLVPARFPGQTTIDATDALAASLIRAATSSDIDKAQK